MDVRSYAATKPNTPNRLRNGLFCAFSACTGDVHKTSAIAVTIVSLPQAIHL